MRNQHGLLAMAGVCAWLCCGDVYAQRIQHVDPILIQQQSPDRQAGNEFTDDTNSESVVDVKISAELLAIVERLDTPVFADRENALSELVQFNAPIEQLRALLGRESISLEVRHRLLTAARMQLIKKPRGALGIRMRWWQNRIVDPVVGNVQGDIPDEKKPHGESEVLELLPDLPARRVLRIGDRITHVDGEVLRTRDDLLKLAQTRQPGDTIKLTIRRVQRDDLGNAVRDEKGLLIFDELHVKLTLGSAEKLLTPNGNVLRDGPVIAQRERTARRLAEQFGTTARRLHLDPDSQVQRPKDIDVHKTGSKGFQLVDQHQYVVAMLREKKLIQQGKRKNSEIVRIWQARLLDLQQQIADRNVSSRDRQYLSKVLKRCKKIMTQ